MQQQDDNGPIELLGDAEIVEDNDDVSETEFDLMDAQIGYVFASTIWQRYDCFICIDTSFL